MTLRVAHINLERGFRGGERQAELLIRGLARLDVQQVLVARHNSLLVERLADVDVDIRGVSGGLLAAVRATPGVDIVHAHEGRGVYAAWLRSLLSGTPYIITRRVSNRLGTGFITRSAYRRAAFVAGVANEIAGILRRYDASIRVRVIYSSSSGLSVDAATVQSIRDAYPGKWLVGNVGALDNRQKGQDYIIEVAGRLQESHPDLQFMLVGSGDDEAMLRELADGLRNLVFTGFVDNVGDYLAAFDSFILPSNKEGIGAILIDAMEQGLPVVASRVGGLPELVTDDDNGILIDAGRTDQLQAAILRLYENPDLCRRLGEHGRHFARGFPAAGMSEKYLGLYREALGE